MNLTFTRLFTFLVLFGFIASCSPKIPSTFKEQQELHYSRSWKKMDSYPMKFGRTDDLHFFNPDRGFVISSEGKMFLTEDGGETWELKFEKEMESFFRCLTFRDSLNGWMGTLGTGDNALRSDDPTIMYETHDGGESWSPTEFDGPYPGGLCGLQTVSDKVIVGCGRVRGPSYFIKSTDGGATWKSYDMNHLAGSLIAPYFYDENHGMLIGGTTQDKIECRSLILETFDGGATWDTMYVSKQKGEYCWKVSYPSEKRGFISIQRNVEDGYTYCLQTEDGGKTWFENFVTEGQYYVQGVGFINENLGWLGGSTGFTMETRDGGKTWMKMVDIGSGFNKFQFFGDSLAYGTGFGVFKMKNPKPLPNSPQKDYFENGKLASNVFYKNGLKHGHAEYYYENGTLKSHGSYNQNLRSGKWTFFNENGEVLNKIKFKNGQAKISKETYKDFIGSYRVRADRERIITLENGKLYSKLSGSSTKFEIYPISTTEFIYENEPRIQVEFVRDEDGKVTHHLMRNRGRESRAEKM